MSIPTNPSPGNPPATPEEQAAAARPPLQGVLWDIVLNAVIPTLCYKVARHYGASEFKSLVMASLFPLAKSLWDLLRFRQLDPIAIIVFLGILTDGIAITLGGSPRLLLVRESIFTGAFGVACLVSLLFPRPLMFYFGRHFMAGSDPHKQVHYNASWALPEVRFSLRLITGVWGVALVSELLIRLALIYTLTPAEVLMVSPILLGAITVSALVWSFRHGYRTREKVLHRVMELHKEQGK